MKTSKVIYFENLDGLRFLCFLSVFLFHSFHSDFEYITNDKIYHFIKQDIFGNGYLGVNFFFVLSGFLITFLLIDEKKKNGKINLKKFWIRRLLRIWPLFYACVFFGFYGFPILKSFFGQTPNETASIGYYLTFTNNFDFINKGLPDASVLGVLWSVAIEEQFYLIWPVVLSVFPIKRFWIAFTSIIVISLVFRAVYNSYNAHEFHTLSCIGDMAIGSFAAWLVSEKKTFKKYIIELSRFKIAFIYLLFTSIYFFRDELLYSESIIRVFERPMIACVIALIIIEQCYSENSFFKLSNFKTISKLGLITYGLYCLHFIGILITTTVTKKLSINTQLWQTLVLDTTIALALTIIIAQLSYRVYERPFLKLKSKFAYKTSH